MTDLSAKLNDLNPYDVTLVVRDGKEFRAHRQVLSEASPFFEKLLNSDMKEKKEGVIGLEILTNSQMADILEFIYTGKIQISTQEQAENLIIAADYLFLSSLKQKAGKFLEKNTSTSNCFYIYHIAENYLCEELIASTQKFINSNFAIIAETENFMNSPSHEVKKWISSDEIVIGAEEDVFKIVLKWIDYNRSERSVKFSELFRHVRLTFVPRDVLMRDVVTNEFVKGNKDCHDSVTGALSWVDRSTDCKVPRPHTPRKALETCVIAVCGKKDPFHNSLYFPEKDVLYRLPDRAETVRSPEHIISCHGKLFVVSQDINKAQCYDPDLNCWSPAPWANFTSDFVTVEQELTAVLVVKSEIYFIVENSDENLTWLWRYDLDAKLTVQSIQWLDKTNACLVVVDRYIYAVGGYIEDLSPNNDVLFTVVAQSARFDTQENEWQDMVSLQQARYQAFGVELNRKVFVAGGCDEYQPLTTCEVYDIEAHEWHFISSLTFPPYTGSMVLFDGTLYAFCPCGPEQEWVVECYDLEKDEWNTKTCIPITKKEFMWGQISATSFKLYKGSLNNLEPTYIKQIEKPQSMPSQYMGI